MAKRGFDAQPPFEEVGERNGLRLLTRQPRDGAHDWAVVGPLGAVQLTGYGASPEFPADLQESFARLRMGWDAGLHFPRSTQEGSVDYHDCPLVAGGCSFEVNGPLGWATHERIEHEMEEEGIDFDEAAWRVLEATYVSQMGGDG